MEKSPTYDELACELLGVEMLPLALPHWPKHKDDLAHYPGGLTEEHELQLQYQVCQLTELSPHDWPYMKEDQRHIWMQLARKEKRRGIDLLSRDPSIPNSDQSGKSCSDATKRGVSDEKLVNKDSLQSRVGHDSAEDAYPKSLQEEKHVDEFNFVPSGTGFEIAGFGESGFVHDLKGFRQLYVLIRSKQSVPMLQLIEGADNEQIRADKRSVQPVIDETAKKEYHEKINELKRDCEEAIAAGNDSEVERIENEREAICKELERTHNIHGKSRDMNSLGNKMRPAIFGTLKTAYEHLRKAPMTKIAEHFELSVGADGTGKAFSYSPADERPNWQTE